MKLLQLLKFLMIVAVPFLLFLVIFNFAAFNKSFYEQKFMEYDIEKNLPQAISLHEDVINFLKGRANELPDDFNQREKQHLLDVRNAIRKSTIALYFSAIFFVLLMLLSFSILKNKNSVKNFIGKVLFFGGLLTIFFSIIFFVLLNSNFAGFFEFFHGLLFAKGTYAFDPQNEIIVNLYPEQLFMDIGIRISEWVIFLSAAIILIGAALIKYKSKKNKNKPE